MKGPWSNEEEWIIYLCRKVFNQGWIEIAKILFTRSDNDIKNYWNSVLKQKAFTMEQSIVDASQVEIKKNLGDDSTKPLNELPSFSESATEFYEKVLLQNVRKHAQLLKNQRFSQKI
jgi:hypothetical protein